MEGGGFGVSFSASAGYKEASSTVQSGKYKLIISTARCKYYFAKLNYLDLPEFSPEVMEWIGRMNHSLATRGVIDDTLVFNFVDYFGTHVPSEMVYGARFTYESKVTSSNYNKMSSSEISVEVKASYSGVISVGGGTELTKSQQDAATEFREKSVTSTISVGAPPPIDGNAMTWASTVKDTPVPVEFDLIPIYELFDNRKFSLRQHFGSETSRMIRNKIIEIASKYCRMSLAKGVDVQCDDDSVIKIDNYAIDTTGLPTDGTKSLNLTIDQCIATCTQRKTCAMITVYPENHTETNQGHRCSLYDNEEERIGMNVCQSCKSFILPNGLISAMMFKSLTYPSSVSRNNKMDVGNSYTYEQIKQFCSVVCSTDPRCTGFEISDQTQFTYNCATYSEHNSNFEYAKPFQFETYIMPELAKREFREKNLLNNNLTIHGLKLEFGLSIMLPRDPCLKNCKSNFNCLVSSLTVNRSMCIHVMNDHNTGIMSVKEDNRSQLVIFTGHSNPEGWVNISLPHVYIDKANKTSGLKSAIKDRTTMNDCGAYCTEDILCRFVFWDTNRVCVKFTSASLKDHQSIIIHEYGTDDKNAILMIPNLRTKMRRLMMAN